MEQQLRLIKHLQLNLSRLPCLLLMRMKVLILIGLEVVSLKVPGI